MRTWYYPSPCGDYRLNSRDEKTCVLTVIDPTPGEIADLSRLLEKARAKQWCSQAEGIGATGKTELLLTAPVHEVGAVLFTAPKGRPLLTVASEGGRVTVVFDSGEPEQTALVPHEDATPAVPEKDKKALVKSERATSVSRPRVAGRGDCPETLASEVLAANCTAEQWDMWTKRGFLLAHGNLSGHTYRVAHRKRHVGRGLQDTVAVDLDEGAGPVMASDWMLPPPEEVLSIKLVLEHREHWLRHPQGMPEAREMIFADPFPELSMRDHKEAGKVALFEFNLQQILQGNQPLLPARALPRKSRAAVRARQRALRRSIVRLRPPRRG